VKAAPLTLLLVWAAPARADVAVPSAPKKKTWRDGCVVRIDAAAKAAGLPDTARITVVPLLHEDGSPNPVLYVEYGVGDFTARVGEEPETRPDQSWRGGYDFDRTYEFRRYHNRFATISGTAPPRADFRRALDDCLKMGEPK
jgi:hypothetical protein